ncbi:MAG: hypothetical protein EOM26_00190 [Alphaproteobacteria bacterium]|nr:hypothetical protein [Alphaproteobacteria bacterium]
MISRSRLSALRALARAYGILPSFENNDGNVVWAPTETLIGLVNAIEGRKVLDPRRIDERKIREQLVAQRRRRLDSCLPGEIVAFNGLLEPCPVWLPECMRDEPLTLVVRLNSGQEIRKDFSVSDLEYFRRSFGTAGVYFRVVLHLRKRIPYGYHRIEVLAGGRVLGSSFLISAPRKLSSGPRSWGAFAPTYAIRSERDWGMGGFRELSEVCRFVCRMGGANVGTLPMLAGRMEGERIDASPYSPISRLFWNEIFLDVESLPGWKRPEIHEEDRAELEALRAAELVDYERVYALKKKYIMRAAARFFSTGGSEREEFENFLSEYPRVTAYADDRAAQVPESERGAARRFHLYAQFAAHRQLLALAEMAAAGEAAELYLDYPVGVDAGGFDARAFGHLFLQGFNVGAPPDAFSEIGQDWGFNPMNPRTIAADQFNYFRDSLHNCFRYAKTIRIDHVMGLYRIFCVPHGGKPADGAYIYYPFKAYLAVLSLEAHRHDGIIVGEDLGTVPPQVRRAMNVHGMLRMWLFQFDVKSDPAKTFRSIPSRALASVNTHDMFPFAAWLKGEDIICLKDVGNFGDAQSERLLKARKRILKGWRDKENPFIFVLRNLAESSAQFLLINLEDLWGETKPQNMPGTIEQYPNWKKKFRHTLEVWTRDVTVLHILSEINQNRQMRK